MNRLDSSDEGKRQRLAAVGARYWQAGWLLATAGNLSARCEDYVLITASGGDKGALTANDFTRVDLQGRALPGQPRPSAETSLHTAIYRSRHAAKAVLHVHTVASSVLRPAQVPGRISFAGQEMVKAWGFWEPDADPALAFLPNHSHVPTIGAELEALLDGGYDVPAVVVAGHGITAWGPDLASACRHLEATEFLCRVALQNLG